MLGKRQRQEVEVDELEFVDPDVSQLDESLLRIVELTNRVWIINCSLNICQIITKLISPWVGSNTISLFFILVNFCATSTIFCFSKLACSEIYSSFAFFGPVLTCTIDSADCSCMLFSFCSRAEIRRLCSFICSCRARFRSDSFGTSSSWEAYSWSLRFSSLCFFSFVSRLFMASSSFGAKCLIKPARSLTSLIVGSSSWIAYIFSLISLKELKLSMFKIDSSFALFEAAFVTNEKLPAPKSSSNGLNIPILGSSAPALKPVDEVGISLYGRYSSETSCPTGFTLTFGVLIILLIFLVVSFGTLMIVFLSVYLLIYSYCFLYSYFCLFYKSNLAYSSYCFLFYLSASSAFSFFNSFSSFSISSYFFLGFDITFTGKGYIVCFFVRSILAVGITGSLFWASSILDRSLSI